MGEIIFFEANVTELNIKQEIGRRILEARKAKGLTQKALGELAGNLRQNRLANWEQGARTPGPEEIKQLANALEVSPAFLMCLSDEKQINKIKKLSRLIPLLDSRQACDAKVYIETTREPDVTQNIELIAVSATLLPELSDESFALKMADESMMPEIRIGDVLVIDMMVSPEPGDFVLVRVAGKPEVVVCQYKKLSYTSSEFELMTLNDNWPNIRVSDDLDIKMIGTVIQSIHTY